MRCIVLALIRPNTLRAGDVLGLEVDGDLAWSDGLDRLEVKAVTGFGRATVAKLDPF